MKTNAMNRDTARDLVMSFVSQTSRVNRSCRVARCCRVQVTTELDISETHVIKKLKDLHETPQLYIVIELKNKVYYFPLKSNFIFIIQNTFS